jgi:hypothetical protein
MNEVVRRYNPNHGVQRFDPNALLGDDSTYAFRYDGLGGFSLGKIVKNVGKAVGKAVKDTGHVAGNIVTSNIGKAVIGTGLALTGVGIPAAAAIGAATQAGGGLIKSGGGLKAAASGAVIGGVGGAAAGVAGKVIGASGVGSALQSGTRGIINKVTGGRLFNEPTPSPVSPVVVNPPPGLPTVADMPGPSVIGTMATPAAASVLRARAANINRSPAGSTMAAVGGVLTKATPAVAQIPGVSIFAGAQQAANNASRAAQVASNARATAQKARDQQKKLSNKARSLADRIKTLTAKADTLATAGDQVGAGKIADEIRKITEQMGTVQQAANTAADIGDRAGAAVVAATNAGIGAAATGSAGFGETLAGIASNPIAVIGLGVGAFLLLKPRGGGYESSRRGAF